MFGLSARILGFYAAFAFPVALFCAIPLVREDDLDEQAERRYLRPAWLLLVLSPLHVLFPLTTLGMAREAERLSKDASRNREARRRLAMAGVVGVIVAVVAVILVAGTSS
jgi:uncharacterized membrane protein